jgi:sirohydrochlorin ferrochelatase
LKTRLLLHPRMIRAVESRLYGYPLLLKRYEERVKFLEGLFAYAMTGAERLQGGNTAVFVGAQMLCELKERDKELRSLSREIEVMDTALAALSAEEMEIVKARYFRGEPWRVVVNKAHLGKSTFYRVRLKIIRKLAGLLHSA